MARRILPLLLLTAFFFIGIACGGKDGMRYFDITFQPPGTVVLNFVSQHDAIRSREIVLFKHNGPGSDPTELLRETVIGNGKFYTLNFPFVAGTEYFLRYHDMFDQTYSAWYKSVIFSY